MARKTGISAVALLAVCGTAHGMPDGPVVTSGQASFNSSPGSLTITNSPGTIINWRGFSTGVGELTRFNQQSASSAVLNRVVGSDPSSILGALTSNGRVFLINPHGIIFGRGATIDTSGFIASTLNISDRDFLEGRLRFEGGGNGVLKNEGTIRANGDIYLVGPLIENTGLIHGESGSVLLAAGQSVTITGPDAQGVQFALQAPEDAALNLGTIEAKNAATMFAGTLRHSGGISATRVTLSAKSEATLEAGSTVTANGEGANVLVWSDDTASVHGTITAKDEAGGKGGFVETSARTLDLNGIRVDTGGGEWLIDPNDFTIAASGGNMSGATLSANLGSGNVTIQSSGGSAGSGDINVNDAVSWSANLLTLTAARDININAVMTASGTSRLTMNTATANGADAAVAGGTVKVGMNAGGFTGRVDFPGRGGAGILTINGNAYTIIQTIGPEGSVSQEDLQGMNGRLDWNFALGGNIDASGTSGWGAGFEPVGSNATPFTGRFNGLGHTVSSLSISRAGTNYVGLFGTSNGDVRNVGISGGSIGGNGYVGALVGDNNGTVSNAYASATVTGASDMVGGLVGRSGSVVANSFATGNVNGNDSVGGLVGFNTGTISNSYYSTGDVRGTNRHIGGLVGFNAFGATTTGSHASGAVTADNIGQRYIGGLAGQNDGTITNSYSTAEVQAYSYAGGLVGYNDGTISGSYSDAIVTTSDQFAGGLAGYNDVGANINTSYNTGYVRADEYSGGLAGWNDGSITVSYNTGSVNGAGVGSMNIGGLAGYNQAVITDTYNTGSVTGDQRVGGLAGALDGAGSITDSYNAGTVTGSSFTGGLVGRYWAGTVTDSYWDTTTSGQAASTGGGTGLTTAQMKLQASFTGLDFTNTWRTYEGNTYPLLKSFLTPLTVTANSGSRVYDGTTNSALGVSYSTTPNANLLGTATVTADSPNVGNRTLTAGGHYSNQQGYDITYANGTLTVNPAPLTVTANNATRTYDGVAYSGGNGVTYGGLVNGETGVVLGGALAYGGSSQGAVNAGNYAITPSGLTSSNYTITFTDGALTINPAPSASSGSPGPSLYRDAYSMFTADRVHVLDAALRDFFHPAIADGAPDDKDRQGVQVCR